jgi:hypothetical protein
MLIFFSLFWGKEEEAFRKITISSLKNFFSHLLAIRIEKNTESIFCGFIEAF